MSIVSNDLESLRQENKDLKKENQELKEALQSLQDASKELSNLREQAAIERISIAVRKKVLGGLGLLGIASIAGFFGIYMTTVNTIKKEVIQPERIQAIVDRVTEAAENEIPPMLVEELKKEQGFLDGLIDNVADAILTDPEFKGRTNSIIRETTGETLQQIPALTESTASVFEGLKYFVIAASSTDPNDLRELSSVASRQGLDAQVCSPKPGNRRSVLLVTDTESIQLTLEAARQVENKAKEIERTAYILPVEPADNVFFDPNRCQ